MRDEVNGVVDADPERQRPDHDGHGVERNLKDCADRCQHSHRPQSGRKCDRPEFD